MKTLLATLLSSAVLASAAAAEPGQGSAVGFDQDLMIVGMATAGAAVASDAPARAAAQEPAVAPSDSQRRVAEERSAQADLPAA